MTAGFSPRGSFFPTNPLGRFEVLLAKLPKQRKFFYSLIPIPCLYPATVSGAAAHSPAAHCTASIIAWVPMQEFSSM